MNAGSGLGVSGVGGVGGVHGVGHGAGAGGLSQAKLDQLRPHQLSAGGVGGGVGGVGHGVGRGDRPRASGLFPMNGPGSSGIGMRRCHDIRRLAMQVFCVDAFTLLLNTIPNR